MLSNPLGIAQEPYISSVLHICAFNLAICAFFDLVSATCISLVSFTSYMPFYSECLLHSGQRPARVSFAAGVISCLSVCPSLLSSLGTSA
ncbi:hypothetical protein IW262DRAFT_378005 [Armillaria fumosa]|nr:hypothetical protein IW262DRAFT_378005 [Armillaria fumosa]